MFSPVNRKPSPQERCSFSPKKSWKFESKEFYCVNATLWRANILARTSYLRNASRGSSMLKSTKLLDELGIHLILRIQRKIKMRISRRLEKFSAQIRIAKEEKNMNWTEIWLLGSKEWIDSDWQILYCLCLEFVSFCLSPFFTSLWWPCAMKWSFFNSSAHHWDSF